MWPNRDNFQILIEKPLNDFFRKLKYNRSQLEEYLDSKYIIYKEKYSNIAFPIIEIDILYNDNKHHVSFKDRFNGMKYPGFKRDRTKHLLIILSNVLNWIYNNNLNSILPLYDFKMYFDVSDSYLEDSEGFPIFVHARDINKNIPLYPDYTYFRMSFVPNGKLYNWDESKEIFKEHRSYKPPITKRIFFRGVDSTSNPYGGDNSNIRNKLKELSSKDPKVEIRIFPESEALKRATPLYYDCGFETYLDLPGNFPWSYRKKFLYLTGGDVIHVKSIWEDESLDSSIDYKDKDLQSLSSSPKGWIQFIDQVLASYSTTEIEFYYKSLDSEDNNNNKIISLYNKIKETSRLNETYIKRRLQRIEMLNMSRLYQYMAKMMMLSSRP